MAVIHSKTKMIPKTARELFGLQCNMVMMVVMLVVPMHHGSWRLQVVLPWQPQDSLPLDHTHSVPCPTFPSFSDCTPNWKNPCDLFLRGWKNSLT